MLSRIRPPGRGGRPHRGVALIVTITVLAVLTSLSATVVLVSINNIQNAGRDRQATGALDIAEAGIAQGYEYMRATGILALRCKEVVDPATLVSTFSPECTDPTTSPWARMDAPQSFTLAPDHVAKVWISELSKPSPPQIRYGTYRIHSVGTVGRVGTNSGGKREIHVTVQAQPVKFPLGVFSENFSAGGAPGVATESVFSTGCIQGREDIIPPGTTATDPAYGIPAGVHTTGYIVEGTGGGSECTATSSKNIHKPGAPCNANYPYDQSLGGGPLDPANPAHAPCLNGATLIPGTGPGTSAAAAYTSRFTDADLARYDYRPGGLSNSEYLTLRSKAISQGTYFKGTTSFTWPDPATNPNPVIYIDLADTAEAGSEVQVQGNDIPAGYGLTNCGTHSVVLVVRGGSARINSNVRLVGSLFIPEGTYRGNGNATIIGTLFAKNIDPLNGTADFSMQQCFLDNPPTGLVAVTPVEFQEVEDR